MDGLNLQEKRTIYWNRLLRGVVVSCEEIDRVLLPFVRDASEEERLAFVILRSCVGLTATATDPMRRNLRAAIALWFSQSGSSSSRKTLPTSTDGWDIHELVDSKLTWQEAALAFEGNPKDYSAYRRLLKLLQHTCELTWEEVFGEPSPSNLGGEANERP